MKKVILITILIVFMFLIMASKKQRQCWEYGSLLLMPSTETVIWRDPNRTIEGSSFLDLAKKMGCNKELSVPPEFPILKYLGENGWELIEAVGQEDSMANVYIYWFKRSI